ncbi:MAG: BrnA antitoxin family protein [Gammaproteobacteria bacterium]|nr:BrnA antitoxin family protein [Gammaproteobacteria bacterium]
MSKKSTSKARPLKASQTDWKHVDSLEDDDIDTSDVPEITPEEFARSALRKGLRPVPKKRQVTLRIDEDVLDWFRAQGRGYQTRINAVLRAFVDANERGED